MTQTSLYATTSKFSNLANNDFLLKADLLIWQVAGNFRRDRSVQAGHTTSQWDKERSQCYPRMPGMPERLSDSGETTMQSDL